MLKDYGKVAQQAQKWATDISLSNEKRKLALNLSLLAETLADSSFGCPTEHYAAQVMYCHLCKALSLSFASCDGACPHSPDCPVFDGAVS